MQESHSPDFMELSTEVAKKFLHTVVFVDDRAIYEEIEQPTELIPPKRRAKKEEKSEERHHRNAHTLNAKIVTDEFASKGMICSVLKPIEGESPLEYVKQAAKRADVFILDWKINNDDGKTAREIIKMLISSDNSEYSRLRLIIIYTGEPDINSISVSIKENIAEDFGTDFISDENNFAFYKGHFRIAIFAKEETNVNPGCEERVLSIVNLPERLSIEFAKITSGLVSNVAIESLSVLRDNTHLFLSNLGTEIDPPYLAHRALLPNPDDAMNHAVDIIASEFHSLLDNFEVGKKANIEAIDAWLKMKKGGNPYTLIWSDMNIKLGCEEICKCQKVGIDGFDWIPHLGSKTKQDKFKKDAYSIFTQTFCDEDENSRELDYKFAILTSVKNRYGGDRSPILTLGTIIKKETENSDESEKYWLCLQPRCDCVRIEENRNFFFIPLEKVVDDRKLDLVIKIDDINYEKLKINQNMYQSIHLKFSSNPKEEQVVRARIEGNDFIFETIDGLVFRWVSELKNEHAQRIANNFAANFSRVGLDESEWLRRV